MASAPETDCDVVIVVRDHYESTIRTVISVLETTPTNIKVFVVAGNMNDRKRSELAALDSTRVAVVGPRQHLIPNHARTIGLNRTTKRFVAFLDNDVTPELGWLGALIEVAERTRALCVRPIVLERRHPRDPIRIHECGGVSRIDEGPSGASYFESHRLMHHPVSDADSLVDQPVGLLEFHCMLFDRERLIVIGGFESKIEAQGEHQDLTLRIVRSGGEIWLAAASKATINFPHRVRFSELGMFLGRWSPTLNRRSNEAFNAKWGITDPDDAPGTWSFDRYNRSQVWLPIARPIQRAIRRGTAWSIAVRFDWLFGRHLAELMIHSAPGWRAWRRSRRTNPTLPSMCGATPSPLSED